MAAEGQQARAVAGNQHLERVMVPAADDRYETIVGLESQQGGRPMKADPARIFQC
jgi:hypothetical protein